MYTGRLGRYIFLNMPACSSRLPQGGKPRILARKSLVIFLSLVFHISHISADMQSLLRRLPFLYHLPLLSVKALLQAMMLNLCKLDSLGLTTSLVCVFQLLGVLVDWGGVNPCAHRMRCWESFSLLNRIQMCKSRCLPMECCTMLLKNRMWVAGVYCALFFFFWQLTRFSELTGFGWTAIVGLLVILHSLFSSFFFYLIASVVQSCLVFADERTQKKCQKL